MLLRRVITHVRNQEWTAIAIDFAIVVLGVFIGTQVSNWNEVRKSREAQQALIVRLEKDFTDLETDLANLMEDLTLSAQSTAQVINTLREDAPPASEEAFKVLLAQSNWVQFLPGCAATYTEILSTGALSQVTDPELRGAIAEYGDTHAQAERVFSAAYGVVFAPGSNYYTAVEWNTDWTTWQAPDAVLAYDFDRLRASRAEMQSWITFQVEILRQTERELEAVRTILKLLREENA